MKKTFISLSAFLLIGIGLFDLKNKNRFYREGAFYDQTYTTWDGERFNKDGNFLTLKLLDRIKLYRADEN